VLEGGGEHLRSRRGGLEVVFFCELADVAISANARKKREQAEQR